MACITRFRPDDRERWGELWAAYLAFYATALPLETYETTWSRLVTGSGQLHGFGVREANDAGPLVGIVHYLFHSSAWTPSDVCYLQDLFVEPVQRGNGYARQLIDAVTEAARERSCSRLYWMTQSTNATARRLYDRVAITTGFIEYERSVSLS